MILYTPRSMPRSGCRTKSGLRKPRFLDSRRKMVRWSRARESNSLADSVDWAMPGCPVRNAGGSQVWSSSLEPQSSHPWRRAHWRWPTAGTVKDRYRGRHDRRMPVRMSHRRVLPELPAGQRLFVALDGQVESAHGEEVRALMHHRSRGYPPR